MMTQKQPESPQPGFTADALGFSGTGDSSTCALSSASTPKTQLLNRLRNQIRSVETAGRVENEIRVSSGCTAIDRMLPSSGYQRGGLVQWLTSGGHGADYLSLLVAKQACADGGALVVFDPLNQFYPPAATAIGINLDNSIILRTSAEAGNQRELEKDLLWSIDQALRCPAVAAVWGPLDQINERWFRRFQLSAESSGCLGLFIQPVRAARQPSWAEVQWMVSHVQWLPAPLAQTNSNSQILAPPKATNPQADHEPLCPAFSSEQQVRLQLTRCRGAQTGKTINLSINTITGNVQLARRDHGQHPRNNIGTSPPTNRNSWPAVG